MIFFLPLSGPGWGRSFSFFFCSPFYLSSSACGVSSRWLAESRRDKRREKNRTDGNGEGEGRQGGQRQRQGPTREATDSPLGTARQGEQQGAWRGGGRGGLSRRRVPWPPPGSRPQPDSRRRRIAKARGKEGTRDPHSGHALTGSGRGRGWCRLRLPCSSRDHWLNVPGTVG